MNFNKLFARRITQQKLWHLIKIAIVGKKRAKPSSKWSPSTLTALNAIGRETVTLTDFKYTPLESSLFDLQRGKLQFLTTRL